MKDGCGPSRSQWLPSHKSTRLVLLKILETTSLHLLGTIHQPMLVHRQITHSFKPCFSRHCYSRHADRRRQGFETCQPGACTINEADNGPAQRAHNSNDIYMMSRARRFSTRERCSPAVQHHIYETLVILRRIVWWVRELHKPFFSSDTLFQGSGREEQTFQAT